MCDTRGIFPLPYDLPLSLGEKQNNNNNKKKRKCKSFSHQQKLVFSAPQVFRTNYEMDRLRSCICPRWLHIDCRLLDCCWWNDSLITSSPTHEVHARSEDKHSASPLGGPVAQASVVLCTSERQSQSMITNRQSTSEEIFISVSYLSPYPWDKWLIGPY